MNSQPLSARRASPLSPPPCAHLSASVFIPSPLPRSPRSPRRSLVIRRRRRRLRFLSRPLVVRSSLRRRIHSSSSFFPSFPSLGLAPFPAVLLSFRRYSSAVALAVFVFFLSPAGSLGEIRTCIDRCRTPKSRTKFRPIHFRVRVHERITITLLALKRNGP